MWDLSGRAPREREVLRGHTHYVEEVAFSPDGESLAPDGRHLAVVDQHTLVYIYRLAPVKKKNHVLERFRGMGRDVGDSGALRGQG